jgi:hypothetical protein
MKRGVLKARDLNREKTVPFGTAGGRYFVAGGEAGAGAALPEVEGVGAAAA